MEERILKSHKISIFNRSSGIISGVKEVISFDPNEIILDTEQGMLMIQGEELHVTKLTVDVYKRQHIQMLLMQRRSLFTVVQIPWLQMVDLQQLV